MPLIVFYTGKDGTQQLVKSRTAQIDEDGNSYVLETLTTDESEAQRFDLVTADQIVRWERHQGRNCNAAYVD